MKTTAMDGHLPFLRWSPANPWMVTHQKEINYRRKIWDLHLTHKTAMDGHLPFLEWSPTNPRMVTDQKDINYILGIWA